MELHQRPVLADCPDNRARLPPVSLQPHVDRLILRHPNPRALLPHHRGGFVEINNALVLPHVTPELLEEVLLLAEELLLDHLAPEAELVARFEVAYSMPSIDIGQGGASDPFNMRPLQFDRVTALLKSEILLLTQGVECSDPLLLPLSEATVLAYSVAGLDTVDELAVVQFVLSHYSHHGLVEKVHLPRYPLQRIKDIVCCPKFAKAVEDDLFLLGHREMLPPDLGHCLLALRLEALGQFIPDPVDCEDLVVDGALGDSWH